MEGKNEQAYEPLGNAHTQKGTYTRVDGTTAMAEDVWFEKDAA